MDSVQSNTPPPEINECNVSFQGQEYYSRHVNSNSFQEYNYDKRSIMFFTLGINTFLTILIIILTIFAIKKYNKVKKFNEIVNYLLGIIILFICALIVGSVNFSSTYIVPNDLKRPCYSTKVNAILYSDEQLNEIYNNK